jgi:hypothetical protein
MNKVCKTMFVFILYPSPYRASSGPEIVNIDGCVEDGPIQMLFTL